MIIGEWYTGAMLTWTQGDKTLVTAGEIDWGLFDPGWIDHVRDKVLGHALETGQCTRGMVAGALVTFHDQSKLSGRKRGGRSTAPVDMRDVIAALAVSQAADEAAAEKKEALRSAIREAYRQGATAPALAEVLPISLARVHQLVAGGRG